MVSVGGLASGLDTSSIISQLVALEQQPITSMQADISELQQVQATFTALAPRFSALRTAAAGLSTTSLEKPSVSLGSSVTAISVSASSTATPASHSISVSQLATAHRLGSQGYADGDSTPIASGAGTFEVRLGNSGAVTSISVTASTTMFDLVNAINAAGGDVSASIVDDGSNALSSRMVLSANSTGRDNEIEIVTNGTLLEFTNPTIEAASADAENAGTYTGSPTSSGTYTGSANKTFLMEIMTAGAVGAATYRVSEDGGLTWDDNGGVGYTTSTGAGTLGGNTEGVDIAFSSGGTLSAEDRFYVDVSTPQITAAQDAVFSLDGITQTRSSNTVTNALTGVTINLSETTSSAISFGIQQDDALVVESVEAFVEAYNDLFTAIRDQQSFDTETYEAGILLGDRTANAILSQMRSAIVRQVDSGSDYDSLASLGITSSRTGGLTIDTTELNEALAADRAGVIAVLASTEDSSSSQLSVATRPSDIDDGTYTVRLTAAPEVATVTAGGAQTDTLSAAETLSFDYSGNYTDSSPTTSNFSVSLQAGDTLAQVINRLNSAFATQGVRLTAFASSNTLNIASTEYGADMYFSVTSDVASGANTSRIGTTALTDTGVDIAGVIDNQPATGRGERLEVNDGYDLENFAINYTGSGTGLVGSITVTTGVASGFSTLVDALSSGTDSVVGARTASIQDQIDQIEERIIDKQEQVARTQARLEEQFASLEVQLSALQSQSDFLTNQLASLSNTSSSSGNG